MKLVGPSMKNIGGVEDSTPTYKIYYGMGTKSNSRVYFLSDYFSSVRVAVVSPILFWISYNKLI